MSYAMAVPELGESYKRFRRNFEDRAQPLDVRLHTAASWLRDVKIRPERASILARNQVAWDGLHLVIDTVLPVDEKWKFTDIATLRRDWESLIKTPPASVPVGWKPVTELALDVLQTLQEDTLPNFEAVRQRNPKPCAGLDEYQDFVKRYRGYLLDSLPDSEGARESILQERVNFFVERLPSDLPDRAILADMFRDRLLVYATSALRDRTVTATQSSGEKMHETVGGSYSPVSA